MNDYDVKLVQESFEKVVPIADAAAELFYGRLFELDPNLKFMFPSDLAQQKKKLMQTLTVVVRGLHKPDSIIPAVQTLGVKHNDYRVKPEQYKTVGQALLWTLNKGLGDEFTHEYKNAWLNAYNLLAKIMIDAARDAKMHHFGSSDSSMTSQPRM